MEKINSFQACKAKLNIYAPIITQRHNFIQKKANIKFYIRYDCVLLKCLRSRRLHAIIKMRNKGNSHCIFEYETLTKPSRIPYTVCVPWADAPCELTTNIPDDIQDTKEIFISKMNALILRIYIKMIAVLYFIKRVFRSLWNKNCSHQSLSHASDVSH